MYVKYCLIISLIRLGLPDLRFVTEEWRERGNMFLPAVLLNFPCTDGTYVAKCMLMQFMN